MTRLRRWILPWQCQECGAMGGEPDPSTCPNCGSSKIGSMGG